MNYHGGKRVKSGRPNHWVARIETITDALEVWTESDRANRITDAELHAIVLAATRLRDSASDTLLSRDDRHFYC